MHTLKPWGQEGNLLLRPKKRKKEQNKDWAPWHWTRRRKAPRPARVRGRCDRWRPPSPRRSSGPARPTYTQHSSVPTIGDKREIFVRCLAATVMGLNMKMNTSCWNAADICTVLYPTCQKLSGYEKRL